MKTYSRNQEVELETKRTDENGVTVPKGSVLTIIAADYEGDLPLYHLRGFIQKDDKETEVNVWSYESEFRER